MMNKFLLAKWSEMSW